MWPSGHQAGAYPGFCRMKRLGIFLLPPGWDASPSQGYPETVTIFKKKLKTFLFLDYFHR